MKKLACFRCGEEIYFDPKHKSQKGKSIPLDPITGEPHSCSNSDLKQTKTIGEEIMDLEERERERIKRIKYD